MHHDPKCLLAKPLADRIRAAREDISTRWLDRICARVSMSPHEIFPTDDVLDHVPLLIVGIADYIEDPADEIHADMPVVGKAMELGELRYRQGFDTHEILKEYELLGGVMFTFMAHAVEEIDAPCSRADMLQCGHRLFRALSLIQQVTTGQFLRLMGERIREREQRLRGFNRLVSHELKNRVGAILGAQELLRESWLNPAQRERFVGMIGDNAGAIRSVLEDLIALSRLEESARQHKNVLLPQAAAEAARELREFARAHGVEIRIGDLPRVEVNAAVVELCLSNYLSNAIKYSDPAAEERWAEIVAFVRPETDDQGHPPELIIQVRDNGIGIPQEARERLFERFFRAHEGTVTGIEGTGLGLSIVRETIESLGGRVWAEPRSEGGSTFAFSIPNRRAEDRLDGGANAQRRAPSVEPREESRRP